MATIIKDTSIENGRLLKRTPLNIEARLPSYNSLLAFLDNYGTDIGRYVTDYSPNYLFDGDPTFDLVDEPDLYDVVYLHSDGKYYKGLVDAGAATERVMGVRHETGQIADIVYTQGYVPFGTSNAADTLGYLVDTVGISTGDPVYLSDTTAGKLTNIVTDIQLGYYAGQDSDSNYILFLSVESSGFIRANTYDSLENKTIDADLNVVKNFEYERSLSFNGTTSMISFADDTNLNFDTGDFSILLRFRTSTDFSGAVKPIVAKGDGTERYEFVMTTDNKLQFQIHDDTAELTIDSDNALNDGVAHTVVVLGDRSGNYSMVVDGIVQVDTAIATATTVTNAEMLYLGRNEGAVDFFTGEIIAVRFFDRLLSELEARSWARNPFKESVATDETFVVTGDSFAVDVLNDLTTNGNNSSAATDVTVIKPETPVGVTFRDEKYVFSDQVGIGTNAFGLNLAGSTSDFTGNQLHIKDNTGKASVTLEGTTGAYVNLVDLGGDADKKWLQIATTGTFTRMLTLNDDGTTLNDNILVIDHGTVAVGIGLDSPASLNTSDSVLHIYGNGKSSIVLQDSAQAWEIQSDDDLDFIQGTDIRVTIQQGGSVGVGVAAPEEIFHVEENQNGRSDIRLSNTDTGVDTSIGIMFETDTSTTVGTIRAFGANHATLPDYFQVGTEGSTVMTLVTNDTQSMLVDTSQHVLFGTGNAVNTVTTEGWKDGKLIEIAHTGSSQIPMMSLSSSINATATMLGSFQFLNSANTGLAAGTGKTVAAMVAKTVTDGNAAFDSGGVLEWYTKDINGALTLAMDLDEDGLLTVVGGITADGASITGHASDVTGDVHGATSVNTADMIVRRDSSGDFACNEMTGTATSALYSDLAEKYTVAGEALSGMVVSRNFEEGAELKITVDELGPDVFGIISTDPAYLMNSATEGHPITMVGRVPVLIEGPVQKWDLIVPAGNGRGRRMDSEDENVFVIAEALETNESSSVKLVECFAKVITKS